MHPSCRRNQDAATEYIVRNSQRHANELDIEFPGPPSTPRKEGGMKKKRGWLKEALSSDHALHLSKEEGGRQTANPCSQPLTAQRRLSQSPLEQTGCRSTKRGGWIVNLVEPTALLNFNHSFLLPPGPCLPVSRCKTIVSRLSMDMNRRGQTPLWAFWAAHGGGSGDFIPRRRRVIPLAARLGGVCSIGRNGSSTSTPTSSYSGASACLHLCEPRAVTRQGI